MERIVVYPSRRYLYRKLGACLVFAAIGGALAAIPGLHWVGAAIALVGVSYALVLLRELGEETERVIIDDAGIRDSMLPVGTIGWDEVEGAAVQEIGRIPVVALQVRNPERFIRRLPPARQLIARKALEAGLPAIYVTLVGTDRDPAEIAEAIRRRVGA